MSYSTYGICNCSQGNLEDYSQETVVLVKNSLGLGTLGFRFKVNMLFLYLSSQLIFPTHRETPCGIHRVGGAEGGLGNGTGAFIFQKRH